MGDDPAGNPAQAHFVQASVQQLPSATCCHPAQIRRYRRAKGRSGEKRQGRVASGEDIHVREIGINGTGNHRVNGFGIRHKCARWVEADIERAVGNPPHGGFQAPCQRTVPGQSLAISTGHVETPHVCLGLFFDRTGIRGGVLCRGAVSGCGIRLRLLCRWRRFGDADFLLHVVRKTGRNDRGAEDDPGDDADDQADDGVTHVSPMRTVLNSCPGGSATPVSPSIAPIGGRLPALRKKVRVGAKACRAGVSGNGCRCLRGPAAGRPGC